MTEQERCKHNLKVIGILFIVFGVLTLPMAVILIDFNIRTPDTVVLSYIFLAQNFYSVFLGVMLITPSKSVAALRIMVITYIALLTAVAMVAVYAASRLWASSFASHSAIEFVGSIIASAAGIMALSGLAMPIAAWVWLNKSAAAYRVDKNLQKTCVDLQNDVE